MKKVNLKRLIGAVLMGVLRINAMEQPQDATLMLQTAVRIGNKERTAQALANCAEVNAQFSSLLLTPLHVASHNGDADLVDTLLAGGANVHAVATSQLTPLHMAAARGHEAIVLKLIGRGAKVHERTASGVTAFDKALDNGRESIVKLLCGRGAAINPEGKDYLRRAIESRSIECLRVICDVVDVNSVDSHGEYALNYAIKRYVVYSDKRNHAEVVIELLTKGANPDQLDRDGQSPLDYVISMRVIDTRMLQVLLSSGATIQEHLAEMVKRKLSAIENVTLFGSVDELNTLMSSAKIKTDILEHALGLAAGQRRLDIVTPMVLNGVPVNQALYAISVCIARCERLKQSEQAADYRAIEALIRSRSPRTPSPIPISSSLTLPVVQPDH